MKIITVNINKGGTGKTTISHNLAKWLADEKKQKVLAIDGDRSCSLSFSFAKDGADDKNILKRPNIADVFNGESIDFYKVSEYLDFIVGSYELDDHILNLRNRHNSSMIFYMWVVDNIENLEKYDYIVIDTHNDTSLVTYNFLAVADMVLGVAEPSRDGLRAWVELKNLIDFLKQEIIDPVTRKTYLKSEPHLLANRIELSETNSRDFISTIKNDSNYLGFVPKKKLMAETLGKKSSFYEMMREMTPSQQKVHEKFQYELTNTFENILKKVGN